MYNNLEYFVYIKDEENIIGVLSNDNIIHIDSNLLYFSMAVFNIEKNSLRYIPPFFDIIFTCRDDRDIIIRKYVNCYLVDFDKIMSGSDMQVMKDVKIYFEYREILKGGSND